MSTPSEKAMDVALFNSLHLSSCAECHDSAYKPRPVCDCGLKDRMNRLALAIDAIVADARAEVDALRQRNELLKITVAEAAGGDDWKARNEAICELDELQQRVAAERELWAADRVALRAEARAQAMEEAAEKLAKLRVGYTSRIHAAQMSDRDELEWIKAGITHSIAAIRALAAKEKA